MFFGELFIYKRHTLGHGFVENQTADRSLDKFLVVFFTQTNFDLTMKCDHTKLIGHQSFIGTGEYLTLADLALFELGEPITTEYHILLRSYNRVSGTRFE